jgi:omega-6 fatty acid desaturase (delta-12 desaturase)
MTAAQQLADFRSRATDPRSPLRGMGIFAVHVLLYLATLIGAVANFPVATNIVFSMANGVFIALLFIIGHDGCHGSFVPQRRWNLWFARLAFLPCVHSTSLWRRTHNELHHQRTNLKGVDRVWAPMSKDEYDASSAFRRWIERLYRGPFGPLFYYYGEFWLYRMLLPLAPETRANWKRHVPDSVFVVAGFVLTLIAIGALGATLAPGRPLWVTYVTGWVIPFAVWNYVMGLTIYLNHTHPTIPWFRDVESWTFHRGNILSTPHVRIPFEFLVPLYSEALAHTAHHADVSLPVYALSEAQSDLKHRFGEGVQEYTLSFSEYRRIYSACKLFDFERMCWTDFDGNPTSATWATGPQAG